MGLHRQGPTPVTGVERPLPFLPRPAAGRSAPQRAVVPQHTAERTPPRGRRHNIGHGGQAARLPSEQGMAWLSAEAEAAAHSMAQLTPQHTRNIASATRHNAAQHTTQTTHHKPTQMQNSNRKQAQHQRPTATPTRSTKPRARLARVTCALACVRRPTPRFTVWHDAGAACPYCAPGQWKEER